MTNRVTDARSLLASLMGTEIPTLTGRSNRVLRLEGEQVIVGTDRSPAGQPVPIAWVQNALDTLNGELEIQISVESVGYRSAFIGAVLSTIPGTQTRVNPRVVFFPR